MEAVMSENTNTVNFKKKEIALIVFSLTLAVLFLSGIVYIQYKKTHISTDDAFIEGSIHTISPRITGAVFRIYVNDNQYVKKGTLLLELDPEPFLKNLKEAKAGLEAERKKLFEINAMIKAQQKKVLALREDVKKALSTREEIKAMLMARQAELEAKRALLRQAKLDMKRAENLWKKGVIPQERYDKAKTVYDTAVSSVKAAEALKRQTEVSLNAHDSVIAQAQAALIAGKAILEQLRARLKTQEEQVRRREAAVDLARLRLSYTKICAPETGYVTKKTVEVGDQVQVGQPLMAIVPLDDVYVVANYKETKVSRIKPGQRVKIKVDAYPGKVFWGRVDSVMAGTGAAFSLFPPENATGNYVKVVQRIPVKIIFEKGADPDHLLRVGMSVVPTVLAR